MYNHPIIERFLTLRTPSMNTPSHERGSTSLAPKSVTLQSTNDHSKLYEGNTLNIVKKMSLKGCECMIRFLCLRYNLEVR